MKHSAGRARPVGAATDTIPALHDALMRHNRAGTFAADLADWTDADVACHRLGVSIGLFEDADFQARKGVFWTDNPVGNSLYDALMALVRAGVLDHREDPDNQFRWLGGP